MASETPQLPPANNPGSAATLAITGELTVATVGEWHRRLLAQLEAPTAWRLDLAAVERADVFGVQLLCALQRAAAARNLPVRCQGASAALLEAAAAAGVATARFLPVEAP